MIVVDVTEVATTSRLPPIKNVVTSTILESTSGADIMVSPLRIPVSTETLIRRHVAEGALLVQRKSGTDLPSSIGARLYGSLARMRAIGARQWQCILLTTGFYLPDMGNGTTLVATPVFCDDGRVSFDYEVSPMRYESVQSATRHWTWYGGIHLGLACDDEIPGWCRTAESRLIRKKKQGRVKQIWPDHTTTFYDPPAKDDPLQTPIEVRDWRAAFVVAFKGIGPVLVNNLRNAMLEFGCADTFYNALFWASAEDPRKWGLPKIVGWGWSKRQCVRDGLGLQPGQDVRLDWNSPPEER